MLNDFDKEYVIYLHTVLNIDIDIDIDRQKHLYRFISMSELIQPKQQSIYNLQKIHVVFTNLHFNLIRMKGLDIL